MIEDDDLRGHVFVCARPVLTPVALWGSWMSDVFRSRLRGRDPGFPFSKWGNSNQQSEMWTWRNCMELHTKKRCIHRCVAYMYSKDFINMYSCFAAGSCLINDLQQVQCISLQLRRSGLQIDMAATNAHLAFGDWEKTQSLLECIRVPVASICMWASWQSGFQLFVTSTCLIFWRSNIGLDVSKRMWHNDG